MQARALMPHVDIPERGREKVGQPRRTDSRIRTRSGWKNWDSHTSYAKVSSRSESILEDSRDARDGKEGSFQKKRVQR